MPVSKVSLWKGGLAATEGFKRDHRCLVADERYKCVVWEVVAVRRFYLLPENAEQHDPPPQPADSVTRQ